MPALGWSPSLSATTIAGALCALLLLPGVSPAAGSADRPHEGETAGAAAMAHTSLEVTWPAGNARLGATRRLTGQVSPVGTDARVLHLQRAVEGGWVTARTVTSSTGSFSIEVPYDVLGRWNLRVVADASRTAAGSTAVMPTRHSVRPSWKAWGKPGDHSLMNSAPVARWNPCAPIRYRVNAAGARRGAVKDVKKALARVSSASGLQFRYMGSSNVIPQRDFRQDYGQNTDLLIAWAKPSRTDLFAGSRRAVGVGGPVFYPSGYVNGSGKPVALVVKGRVVLSTRYNKTIRRGAGKGMTRVELIMHEVGHAVGLGHAKGKTQIMHPTMQRGYDMWGAGDLAGLRAVGLSQGCVYPAASAQAGGSGDGVGGSYLDHDHTHPGQLESILAEPHGH